MKKLMCMFLLLAGGTFSVYGQAEIRGLVIDAITREALIGANVTYGPGQGTITDVNGRFTLSLDGNKQYNLNVSYIGYEPRERTVNLGTAPIDLEIAMNSITLREVSIVADLARERKTPVAFSSITPLQIKQELAGQDIPLILNTTPGVYATAQGGGDGDARITIRGFDQRNIAVMIDGIPVNDMENGWVYWSNWFGLDMVTGTIQVQRGLSASKLALPSVGGTMNIITEGIDSEPGVSVKQEIGSGNFSRTSFSVNTGKSDNGWGLTMAGSYKKGDGLVNGTFTEGFFYYLKAEKLLGNHRISFSGMGAPQKHGQRSFFREIAMYDRDFAIKHGVPEEVANQIPEYGRYYNHHVGVYEDYELSGSTEDGPLTYDITARGSLNEVNEATNYYHKPQFVLRDFWQINSKMNLATSAYLSIGSGGGTGLKDRPDNNEIFYDNRGGYDFQQIYNNNLQAGFFGNPDYNYLNIDPQYSETEIKASNFLRSSVNNHFWYGFLSQLNFNPVEPLWLTVGVDLRSYKGTHYQQIHEFIGGDYAVLVDDSNAEPNSIIREGDKLFYHDVGLVNWGGLFAQAEFEQGNWTAFINLTSSYSGYKGIDYFKPKMLEVGDDTLRIGYSTVIEHEGVTYDRNSEGLEYYNTGWKWIPSYTAKLGAGYTLTEFSNVYFNVGFMQLAPKFNGVINIDNEFIEDPESEEVQAIELGYNYSRKKVSISFNGYYTIWANRFIGRNISNLDFPVNAANGDPEQNTSVFIRDLDARHMGLELDAAYRIHKKVKLQGIVAVADWVWQSSEVATYQQAGGTLVDVNGDPISFEFDADGVHVGDAAQLQLGASVDYYPIDNAFVRLRGIFFGKNFSQFDPGSIVGENAGRESWRIPDYRLYDLHTGYTFRYEKSNVRLGLSVLNILDTFYISDALNNEARTVYTRTQDFDAQSAGVFPGFGRRFNFNVTLEF